MRGFIQRAGVTALAVLTLSAVAMPAASSAATKKKTPVQKVNVVAKEFSFKLSKKKVNVGTVKFTIKNAGKIPHNFAIDGKKSPMIKPGKTATLTVKFKKKGSFKYVCTVPGHAKEGMEGSLGVGQAAKATPPPPTTTIPAASVGTTPSTIYVKMFDFGFTFYSDAAETVPWPTDSSGHYTAPSGPITFVVNSTDEQHNFALEAINYPGTSTAVASTFLAAGNPPQTMQPIGLAPGQYTYECEVGTHASQGMIGTLDVTPDS